MKNKIIISTILFIIAAVFSLVVLSNNKPANNPPVVIGNTENQPANIQDGIILFYGDGCPHCAIVEKYITENNLESKIVFVQKEVYNNQNNVKELEAKAKICGIPADSIGVPFLWDGLKCLVGDQDIIEFFKSKINE